MAIRRSEIDQILAELSGLQAPSISQAERSNFLNQATELYRPLRERKLTSFNARKGDIASTYADVETRLKEGAVGQQSGMEEDFNRLGLLQSGKTAAGIGKIRTNLSKDISSAAIKRAIDEADLALEQAGFETDLAKQTEAEATGYADKLLGQRQTELGLRSGSLQARLDTLMKLAQLEEQRAARGAAAGSNAALAALANKISGGGAKSGGAVPAIPEGGNVTNMGTTDLIKLFRSQGYKNAEITDIVAGINSLKDGALFEPATPGGKAALSEIFTELGVDPMSLQRNRLRGDANPPPSVWDAPRRGGLFSGFGSSFRSATRKGY